MEIVIFGAMAGAIIYLMLDNRRLEKQCKSLMRALVIEGERRKAMEMMHYGRELDLEHVLDMDEIYED